MAELDRRLLPLIDTLIEVEADWLVFEIMEGIRRGKEPEETEELLKSTREFVRLGEFPERESSGLDLDAPISIVGDQQISWAAEYIERRLDDALAYLYQSFDFLEAIVGGSSPRYDGKDTEFQKVERVGRFEISLSEVDDATVAHEDIVLAQNAMNKLREALAAWARDAREGSTE